MIHVKLANFPLEIKRFVAYRSAGGFYSMYTGMIFTSVSSQFRLGFQQVTRQFCQISRSESIDLILG